MDINKFKTDPKATEEGVWLYIDNEQKTGFLVARIGSRKFRESTARHITPHNQGIARGAISIEEQDKMLAKVLAESVVLNWKGLEQGVDANGKPKDFGYTKERCEAMLIAPEYQDFLKQVLDFGGDAKNYRDEEIKKTGNESKPASDGS